MMQITNYYENIPHGERITTSSTHSALLILQMHCKNKIVKKSDLLVSTVQSQRNRADGGPQCTCNFTPYVLDYSSQSVMPFKVHVILKNACISLQTPDPWNL